MAVPRFFVSAPLSPHLVGVAIALPEDVAHYAIRVRRLVAGDRLTLFTGEGGEYAATITQIAKRGALVRIDAFSDGIAEPAREVVLAQALVANDAMDTIVRHAVELGAASVQPLVTTRSARFPAGAHGDKRLAHWRAIAVSACEQCGRNRIPGVLPPADLASWLAGRGADRVGLILAPEGAVALPQVSLAEGPLDVLVGPEGGFTDDENANARQRGFAAARLGPRILRAETAALAALAVVNVTWSDGR